jgi:hypothetical protein
MRYPRLRIRRSVVVAIVIVLFLWPGPILAPEAVRRWRNCNNRARSCEYLARLQLEYAASHAARLKPGELAEYRQRAEGYAKIGRRYRRSLLLPWEFWSLGDH